MQEVEVKILGINKSELISKLVQLGAKKVFEGEMEICYFDFEDASLRKAGKIVRLRTKGERAELTLKEKVSKEKMKVNNEFETLVDSFDAAKKILEKIGLKEGGQMKKHRISYSLEDAHFELDTLPKIPTYLEIEAHSLERVEFFVKKLGFSMSEAKPWTQQEVMKHYSK